MDKPIFEKDLTVFLIVNTFPKLTESFLFNLVVGLERRGVKVKVLAISRSMDQFHFLDRQDEWSGNIEIFPRKLFEWLYFGLKSPRVLWEFYKQKRKTLTNGQILVNAWLISLIQEYRPNWVHFAFSGIGVQFLPAIEHVVFQKWMVSCRGSAEILTPLIRPDRGKELDQLFLSATLIHCVSYQMVDTIKEWGAPPQKCFVNYPSIDAHLFKRSIPYPSLSKGDAINIVSIGRLSFEKGYSFALLALQKFKLMGFDFKYYIIGDGESRSEIVYIIKALQLQDSVLLLGKLDSKGVRGILETSHVFLLSSLYEGVSNAALEAMAMEVPVLTTRAGGMAEVVHHNEDGILVDCFRLDDLVRALSNLIEEPTKLKAIGRRGRETILKKYSIEKQINIFCEKYLM